MRILARELMCKAVILIFFVLENASIFSVSMVSFVGENPFLALSTPPHSVATEWCFLTAIYKTTYTRISVVAGAGCRILMVIITLPPPPSTSLPVPDHIFKDVLFSNLLVYSAV